MAIPPVLVSLEALGRKEQQEELQGARTLMCTAGGQEAWPDLKAGTIMPKSQVLARPGSYLPRELGNCQTPVRMKTNSLVFLIHLC